MRTFFRDTLKRDLDAFFQKTSRIRVVMAAWKIPGPGSVKRAVQFALRARDVNPVALLRALRPRAPCDGRVQPGGERAQLGHQEGAPPPDTLASDLARLSGKPLDQLRATYAPGGKLGPEPARQGAPSAPPSPAEAHQRRHRDLERPARPGHRVLALRGRVQASPHERLPRHRRAIPTALCREVSPRRPASRTQGHDDGRR